MSETPLQRPAPRGSRDSAFFWEGCKRGVLLGQRCAACGVFRHPPRPMCPHCQSLEREEVELSGHGTLHSWCKPVHPPLPMFDPGTLVALVDLEEGPRVLSNLDAWIRRRLRMYIWRQWQNGPNRFKELRRRGVPKFGAAVAAGSPTGWEWPVPTVAPGSQPTGFSTTKCWGFSTRPDRVTARFKPRPFPPQALQLPLILRPPWAAKPGLPERW